MQDHLKVLEEIMEVYNKKYYKEQIKALSYAISTIKAMEEAKMELPEKRECQINPIHLQKSVEGLTKAHFKKDDLCNGFNQAIDLCTPIVAKLKQRIAELEEHCRNLHDEKVECGIDELQQRIEELEEDMEFQRRATKNYCQESMDKSKEIEELKEYIDMVNGRFKDKSAQVDTIKSRASEGEIEELLDKTASKINGGKPNRVYAKAISKSIGGGECGK